MRVDILTLFPGMFSGVLGESIMKRTIGNGILDIRLHDIREYAANKYRRTDDYTFGGGAGLLMMVQPLDSCLEAVTEGRKPRILFTSPRGRVFDNEFARELAEEEELVIVCGHYEGYDERVRDIWGGEEVSIGDYVLTGGELPAMVITDSLSRFVKGVLHNDESAEEESFEGGLLEYPQYTRPSEYKGLTVPEVLLSGHHDNIRKWRLKQSLRLTRERRPELLEGRNFTKEELKLLREIEEEDNEYEDVQPQE